MCVQMSACMCICENRFLCLPECRSCCGLSAYTFSPLFVIFSGVQALEHEGEQRFPPHWGRKSPPLLSCRHGGNRLAPVRGVWGRHRTYNYIYNKFEKWGTHWPIGITPSLTLTMLRRGRGGGVVCACLRERNTETDKKRMRQRGKGMWGQGEFTVGHRIHRGERILVFFFLVF